MLRQNVAKTRPCQPCVNKHRHTIVGDATDETSELSQEWFVGGGFDQKVGGSSLVRDPRAGAAELGPGKQTLTQQLPVNGPVQRAASATPGQADTPEGVQRAASEGIAGGGGRLPHGDTIQRLFGRHDISGIEAHVGGPATTASRAIGAEAYATGNHVAFAGTPSLHTAAHEAAHVVQQRGGVQLKGGVGESGDAYEQHADQVADAVVQGKSAEALLDRHAGGSGGGAAVQRQAAPAPATQPADPVTQPAAPAKPDPAAIAAAIKKLDAVAALTFADIKDDTLAVDGVTTWLTGLGQALADAKAAAVGSPPELSQAIDRCLTAHAAELKTVADKIKAATIQISTDSSVAKATPKKATLPTAGDVHALSRTATQCGILARDAQLPGSATTKATLQTGSAAMQDAALAMLQSISVVTARDRWKTGTSTQTPDVAKAGKGPRTEIDDVFKDSGWNERVSVDTDHDKVYDWCGMFVVSSYYKGAGLASQLRSGFYHTDNVQDFFKYEQLHNPDRVPSWIWADGQWSSLHDYHQQRGSVRKWTPRATIQAALKAGQDPDIRPGDTCLIDHGGGNKPVHIVMVESYNPTTKILVSIEGNTYGVVADGDKAAHVDDDHLKDFAHSGASASGIHEIDMSTLAPGPMPYTVSAVNAYLREDADPTKLKLDEGKKVSLAVGTAVTVTEVKDVAGHKFGHLQDGGWTAMSNLKSAAPALPKGAAPRNAGATVWGVGRPSVVDFEDGHEYSIHAVPAELQHTSPADIKALAKKKDKAGAQAKAVGVK
jgi:hypothetical protein